MTKRRELVLVLALACSLTACADPLSTEPLGQAGGEDVLTGPGGLLTDRRAMEHAFAIARAALAGKELPPDRARLGLAPGRRVFVCAYEPSRPAICTTGLGDNLAASLEKAGRRLLKKVGDPPTRMGTDVRLKIDVATRVEAGRFEDEAERLPSAEVGLFGYWVVREGRVSWVLPSETLERRIYSGSKKGISRERLVEALTQRTPQLGGLDAGFERFRLWTVAWIERDGSEPDRPAIFRVYRVHDFEFEEPNEANLLQRIVWAADHLAASVPADGRMRYGYRVATDMERSSNALLRHAGSTYALLQAYARTKHPSYLPAARAAMDHLVSRSEWHERHGPFGGGRTLQFVWKGSEHVHLGQIGLGLLMLDQYMETTGEREPWLEPARGYGRFLVSQLRESGEFVYRASAEPGGKPKNVVSKFYPGEAILGLMRLHALDPNPLWLDTARRAADWLIDVRDRGKAPRQLAPDHWLLIGLSYLYDFTRDERYVEHSLRLCRAAQVRFVKNVNAADEFPDLLGAYYDPPSATGAATISEGLVAALDTCALAGRSCKWVEQLLLATVRNQMLSQYTPDLMWWPRVPEKTFGGFGGGLIETSIRNDYVQHNLSAILGAERHLAARRGVLLPGGPAGTRRAIGGETFDGVPATEMDRLREASRHYIGKTRWER